MENKKTILIDLDHVLIDTEKIKEHRVRILKRFGISARVSHTAYQRSIEQKGMYHPAFYLHHVTSDKAKRERITHHYQELFLKRRTYNFPGVTRFLRMLSKKYQLVLLSYGHHGFQMKKFRQAELGAFFKRTSITPHRDKKPDLSAFFKKHRDNVLLLDDSKLVIAAAREIGMKTILVRKGKKDAAYYRRVFDRIRAIH